MTFKSALCGLALITLVIPGVADNSAFEASAHATPALATLTHAEISAIFQKRLKWTNGLQKVQADRLAAHLINLSKKYQFDPAFVLGMIEVESTFNPSAESPVGALGLMQLMPATAEAVAKKNGIYYIGRASLLDPAKNIHLGILYMSELRARYKNLSPYHSLAAYNMGPSRFDMARKRPDFKPVATRQYYNKIREATYRYRSDRGYGRV